MVRRSICALLLAAPLSLMFVGCSSLGKRDLAARRMQSAPTSHSARLMNLAERYEQQGNHEGALRLYQQVVRAEPGHHRAQQRIAAISGGRPAQVPAANHTLVAEAAPLPAEPAAVPAVTSTPATPAAAMPVDVHVPPPPAEPALTALQGAGLEESEQGSSPFDVAIVPDPAFAADDSAAEDSEPAPFIVAEPQPAETPELTAEWWGDDADSEVTDTTDPSELESPFEEPSPVIDESPAEWSRTSLARLCDNVPAELQGLIRELDAADPAQRKAALAELAHRGPSAEAALPAIDALLSDSDVLVQVHAAWAIWEVAGRPEDSIDALTQLLVTDTNPHVVQASAYFLGAIGQDANIAADALWFVCHRTTGITRLHAAEALACITPDDERPVTILIQGLASTDKDARWLSALALSSVSSAHRPAAVAALSAALNDSAPEVGAAAALTLGGFGDQAGAAVSQLQTVSDGSHEDVRTAARIALDCIVR